MVIDDSDTNLILVKSIITELGEGYNVIMENDCRLALDKIRLVIPDIVILDIMMPEIDGITILRSMKIERKLRDIPVIILSALHDYEKEREAMDLGANCYLRKPLLPSALIEKVRTINSPQLT